MNHSPESMLNKFWGFSTFRPLQKEIIETVLAGKDVVALLPTGGGKSLCYQLPALCRKGTALVISPLIALISELTFHDEHMIMPEMEKWDVANWLKRELSDIRYCRKEDTHGWIYKV